MANCINCDSSSLKYARRYRSKTKHGRAVFGESKLYECQDCFLVQVGPRPSQSQLTDYYFEDYRKECISGSAGAIVADIERFPKDNLFYFNRGRSITELIGQYCTQEPRSILDIGSGFGHVLFELGQRYPCANLNAIEVSEMAIRHLESIGIRVVKQPAEEVLSKDEQRYDLIILSHVLEHLLEPKDILRLIFKRLEPGGILYIEVPNIPTESLLRYPDHVWAPRFDEPHISFFSASTLTDLLIKSGFDTLFCDSAGPHYRYVSSITFKMPHWRWFIQEKMPSSLFHFLRRQSLSKSLRVKEREESFYQYGGFRIWIRSISQKGFE